MSNLSIAKKAIAERILDKGLSSSSAVYLATTIVEHLDEIDEAFEASSDELHETRTAIVDDYRIAGYDDEKILRLFKDSLDTPDTRPVSFTEQLLAGSKLMKEFTPKIDVILELNAWREILDYVSEYEIAVSLTREEMANVIENMKAIRNLA